MKEPSWARSLALEGLGPRAVVVTGSYIASAAVVLTAVLILKRHAPPAVLGAVMSFFFVSSLASGLEPATAKAQVLRDGEAGAADRPAVGDLMWASSVKALAASPLLALLWRFTDPHLPPEALLLAVPIAVAGFSTTDLRVLFDLKGRHALAIWLKQGSLAAALVIAVALVLSGVMAIWAMAIATALRLALSGLAARRAAGGESAKGSWRGVRRHLRDVRWIELMGASMISALGGSTDRILALRYLAPATYATYFVIYEVFTKFWVLPYIVNPILFARLAARQASGALVRRAFALIVAAGVGFVVAVAGATFLAPAILAPVLGQAFGPGVIAFAAAIVISAIYQVWMAWLQGSGHTRRATILIAVNTVVSTALFYALVRRFGLNGLFIGWLAKSTVEVLVAAVAGRPRLSRGS